MKTSIIFLTVIFWVTITSSLKSDPSADGELLFRVENATSGKFNLTVSTSEYVWSWDQENNKIIRLSSYNNSYINRTALDFDAPKSWDDQFRELMPWGKIYFVLSSLRTDGEIDFAKVFTIDFRDEDWVENTLKYPSHDTYIYINQTSKSVRLQRSNPTTTLELNGNTISIWNFWNAGSPRIENFIVPVKLVNEVENTTHHFGYLIANGNQVATDSNEDIKITNGQVFHGSLEEVYINRRYSFKWSHQIVVPFAGSNPYLGNTVFSTDYSISNLREVKRNFRTVWPLTIKNFFPEYGNTLSYGEISFKDPTTDNQFHNYPATNEGFVKNEAFEGLNENIPGYGFSKYSVKAISPMPYNGRNYYWQNGDFNPTTQTDLLITAQTLMTANYKGTQISNNTTAYSNNSQRKFIRTPNGRMYICYESMGYVWLERSTDNGTTWELMHYGKPIGNTLGKSPSMDYDPSGNLIVISYQEYYYSDYKCRYVVYHTLGNSYRYGDVEFETNPELISGDAQMVVAWNGNGNALFLLKDLNGNIHHVSVS